MIKKIFEPLRNYHNKLKSTIELLIKLIFFITLMAGTYDPGKDVSDNKVHNWICIISDKNNGAVMIMLSITGIYRYREQHLRSIAINIFRLILTISGAIHCLVRLY